MRAVAGLRTGWLDVASRAWWDEALDWSGADVGLMPPLVEAGTALGRVGGDRAPDRAAGAVLTIAGHDHQAAAVGAGAVAEGDELDSCGTAEALVRTVAPGIPPERVVALAEAGVTVGWHALPGYWCLLGATTGGLTLQRVAAALGLDAEARRALPVLDAAGLGSLRVTTSGDGVALTGIRDDASPAAVWAAAVASACDDAARLHEAMTELGGPHREVVATGGWSRDRSFMAAKRARLGPVRTSEEDEAGARGAAVFAEVAAGLRTGPAEEPAGSDPAGYSPGENR